MIRIRFISPDQDPQLMDPNLNQTYVGYYYVIVAGPDPDPYVFGPPGSGSVGQRYGSGYGSFYHQAKTVRKPLIPTVL